MEKLPKLTFFRSPITEAVHYVAISADLYKNFYQDNNIYILPRLVKKYGCIYYPYVEQEIPLFWKKTLKKQYKVKNNDSKFVKQVCRHYHMISWIF